MDYSADLYAKLEQLEKENKLLVKLLSPLSVICIKKMTIYARKVILFKGKIQPKSYEDGWNEGYIACLNWFDNMWGKHFSTAHKHMEAWYKKTPLEEVEDD